ncbi:hypothetical protein [Bacillus sp. CECT 9360]|uniref:hypothetical protein n=1 Tax=Bacillus sp. CECT 9360 TaxID=2845821 RepID=UPI001E2C2461|nr:hypothetical protein [Bacillus sp. CECT 9360]
MGNLYIPQKRGAIPISGKITNNPQTQQRSTNITRQAFCKTQVNKHTETLGHSNPSVFILQD